jgi:hypothetical protein
VDTTAIENALVKLKGGSFALDTTDNQGRYHFRELLAGLEYSITVSTKAAVEGNVICEDDLADLHRLLKELAGHNKLSEIPFPKLHRARAADVNLDSTIDMTDRNAIAAYLNKMTHPSLIQHTGEWAFFPTAMFFRDKPPSSDFSAAILGNVNTIWPPNTFTCPDTIAIDRSKKAPPVVELSPGETFKLPFDLDTHQMPRPAKVEVRFDETQVEALLPEDKTGSQAPPAFVKTAPGLVSLDFSETYFAEQQNGLRVLSFRVVGSVGDSSTMSVDIFSAEDQQHVRESASLKIVKKIPQSFFLSQNYPNPFNPTTTIAYGLPRHALVEIRIFNVTGQLVHTVVNQTQEAGYHKIHWNGKNAEGRSLPSGLYFMRMKSENFIQIRKLTLLK